MFLLLLPPLLLLFLATIWEGREAKDRVAPNLTLVSNLIARVD